MARDFDNNAANHLTVSSDFGITDYPVTMACWLYNDNSQTDVLMSFNEGGTTNAYLFLGMTSAEILQAECRHGTTGTRKTANASAAFNIQEWVHGCAVFSSSTSCSVYMNGGNSGTASGTTTSWINNAAELDIGNDRGYEPYDGGIAEVCLWNAALSAAEIAALAKGVSPLRIRPQSLRYYDPMYATTGNGRSIINGYVATENGTVGTRPNHPPVQAPFYRAMVVPVAGGGAPPAATPKGPLGHPLNGALGGLI